jgi:hypothetical protein
MTDNVRRPYLAACVPHSKRVSLKWLLQLFSIPAALTLLNSASADIQTNNQCTPTKTIQLDLPNTNWRDAEQQIRARYGSAGLHYYSVAELEKMITRPTTATQLLQNLKIAVDRELLTQRNFFETPVLDKFFNASSVSWSDQRMSEVFQRNGVAKLFNGPFAGYEVKVQMTLIPRADQQAHDQHRDHFAHWGTLDLVVEQSGLPITVKAVADAFGPPPFAYGGVCPNGSEPDPECKGTMSYDFAARQAAGVPGDRIEFAIRADAIPRYFPGWERRTAEGRQRFLCDEDKLRGISLRQGN